MQNYYTSYLEIEKRKQEKRKNLPSFFSASIQGAIIAQFASDIFFSIFFTNNNIIKNDITLTSISSYYAALSTGIIIGIAGQYMDRFALIVLTTISYALAFDLVEALLGEDEFRIDPTNATFDVLAGIILVYIFDPKALNDYNNHINERNCVNKEKLDADKTFIDTFILILVINTYAGYKKKLLDNIDITNTSAADVTIDAGIEL